MKQPFTFPTYGSWCKLHGFVLEQDWIGEKLSQDRKKMYALLYLLALRDWVNEGWEYSDGHYTISYDTDTEEWLYLSEESCITSQFVFPNILRTEEFLSHKFETTNTIEQLNILYSINQ